MHPFAFRLSSTLLIAILTASTAWGQSDDSSKATVLALQDHIVKTVNKVKPAYIMIGGGSGVIFTPDGWILTNNHVAGSKKEWPIITPDRQRFMADLIGTDPRGDIALLKIRDLKEGQNVPYCPLGDSDKLVIGQRVIAVGNPYLVGMRNAEPVVTVGIISALHRFQQGYSDCIQTDAAINPGNSGGPLIDLQGRVIGINGRVAVRFGNRVNTGVGYAIPANQIKNFLEVLRKGGVVSHGVLKGLALDARYPQGKGPVVARISKDSEADLAGFKRGDRILAIHDYPTPSQNRLAGVLGTYPAGTVVPFRIKRGDKELILRAKLTARESRSETADMSRNPNAPFLGVEFSLEHKGTGVEIEKVVPGSAAEKSGLQAGDIILGFDSTEIRNAQHLIHLISRRKVGDKVRLSVRRGNQNMTLNATLASRKSK